MKFLSTFLFLLGYIFLALAFISLSNPFGIVNEYLIYIIDTEKEWVMFAIFSFVTGIYIKLNTLDNQKKE